MAQDLPHKVTGSPKNGEMPATATGTATATTTGTTIVERISWTAERLPSEASNRVLIVDDNPAIHDDFRKVLGGSPKERHELIEAEMALFGTVQGPAVQLNFDLESAHQGEEALEKVRQSLVEQRPYAVAFVDVRMPPGWDGIETVTRIWNLYPELQVVICTAYSDYSWEEMIRKLGRSENLVILKKPFDNIEVLQLASALAKKWHLQRQAQLKLQDLTAMVAQRTHELEAANEDLRREMKERAATERQLRQAQKMEAIGQLAAGVAHDFNNVLTVIHGHASILGMRLGPEGPHVKSLGEIRLSAERAANLVRQLLMFSRKQVMQFRNVDLPEVVRSVSSMLRQLLGEHITLEIETGQRMPAIFADRGMIEQVVVNLAINARDAMQRGGRLLIQVQFRRLDKAEAAKNPDATEGDFVCLSVKDTGCGMDAEALSHLFEPFYTTKEVGKGTGLGLATVYGIIKQHRGWINVQSQVDAGTTFEILFPISHQQVVPPPEPDEAICNRRGTETILLAEDEAPLRDMVAEILSSRGYRVLAASSGPAAIKLWEQENAKVDLLLTDMVMPGGMLGTDVAVQLKARNPSLKVIFTTGYSPGIGGAEKNFQEGVNFLPKPYSPNKLAEIVRKCLDK